MKQSKMNKKRVLAMTAAILLAFNTIGPSIPTSVFASDTASQQETAEEISASKVTESTKSAEEKKAEKAAEEAAKKESEEAAKKASEEAAKKESEEAAKKASEEAAKKESEEAAKKASEEAAKKESEEAAKKASEEAAKKESEEAAKKASEEAAKKASEEAAKKESEEAAKAESEKVAKETTAAPETTKAEETTKAAETTLAVETTEEETTAAPETTAEVTTSVEFTEGQMKYEGKDYTVTMTYGADAQIPATAKLKVKEIKSEKDGYDKYVEQIEKKIAKTEGADTTVESVRLFDITIKDGDQDIQPAAEVKVEIGYDKAEEITDNSDIKAVHFKDDDNIKKTEVIDVKTEGEKKDTVDTVTFRAEGFSVYGIAFTKTLSAGVLTADGKNYTITVSYNKEAGIPDDAVLEVSEIKEGTDKYWDLYYKGLRELGIVTDENCSGPESVPKGELIADAPVAKFFDVKIMSKGEEIEPRTDVDVEISYSGIEEVDADGDYKSIHFAEGGTEVRDASADLSGDDVQVSFTQDGFSGTGFIMAAKPQTPTNSTATFPKVNTGSGDGTSTQDGSIESKKTVASNGDGSYKVTLDVKASPGSSTTIKKANVIFVMDRSGSMGFDAGGQTRMYHAKRAAISAATTLLGLNTSSQELVNVSLISFADNGRVDLQLTNDLNTFKSKVNGLSANGGTNWEDAFAKVASVNLTEAQKKDPVYVIFISDGNPTYRIGGGTGYETASNIDSCYKAAKDDAEAMVSAGYNLYTVGIYGDVDRMKSITTDAGAPANHYYAAADTAALNKALGEIAENISNSLNYTGVKLQDGVTKLSTVAVGAAGNQIGRNFTYKKGGKAWSDAPKASVGADNKVTWDLSAVGALEKDVTYSVSFDLWPSQEAYDTVADLNNGDKEWSKVDQTQYVKNSDGSYSLKTNTGDQTLTYTYSDKTTTTSIPAANGNMALLSSKLSVVKAFDSSLYGNDYSTVPESFELTLNRDGAFWKKITVNKKVVDGKTVWKSDDIYIAPGLKISGKVVEPGHDYTIAGENLTDSYKYELTSDTQHPMIEGTTLPNNGQSVINAVNHSRGYIEVNKVVTGEAAPKDADGNFKDEFTFKITFTNLSDDDLEQLWYTKTDAKGEKSSAPITDLKKDGNAFVFKLKGGENFRVLSVPKGVSYTVSEVPAAGYKTTASGSAGGPLDWNEGKTVTYKNEYLTGSLTVIKQDEEDDTIHLPGAKFKLAGTADDGTTKYDKTETTGNDGKVTFTDIPLGTYTLTEENAPTGYEKTFEDQTVTITEGDLTHTVTVTDKRKTGKIVINKTDAQTGAVLSGAVFTLTGTDSMGTEIKPKTAVESKTQAGTYIIENVPFGTYTLTETTAPTGYTVSFQPAAIEVNAGNVANVFTYNVTDNEKTAKVTVNKTDAQTGEKLAGATFTLSGIDAAGKSYSKKLTYVGEGKYELTGVPFGNYTLTETAAPAGYEVNFTPAAVNVDAAHVDDKFEFNAQDNETTGLITVTKSDATTGDKLAGAEFTLTGTTRAGDPVNVTVVTNKDGVASFKQVAFGSYRLTETKAPDGYSNDYPGEDITIDGNNVATEKKISVVDGQKTGKIVISKTDAQSGTALAGATFTLTGTDSIGTSVTKTADDKGDGTYEFTAVPFGTYTIKETAAPTGYIATFEEKKDVTINAGNVDKVLTFDATDDEKKAEIIITKTDAQTGAALAGAEFTLKGKDVKGNDIELTSVDQGNGSYKISQIPFGEYKLSETSAPTGYEINFEEQDVKVNANNVEQGFAYEVTDDEKTATVTVNKTDKQTGAALAGATFNLAGTKADGTAYSVDVTTGADGKAVFNNVPFGEYKLTETKAPKGYEISFKGQDITIDASNVSSEFTYNVSDDEKTATVTVNKTDKQTGAALAGATFNLAGTKADGTAYSVDVTTGADGRAVFNNVPFGKYKLTETEAPTGYAITFEETAVEVTAANVEDAQNFVYAAADNELTATVEVAKYDGTTNAMLTGAVFTLTGTDAAGNNKVLTSTDKGGGKYEFTEVPFGRYELAETTAPQGYALIETTQTVVVNAENVENVEAHKYSVADNQLTAVITINKIDAQTGAALAGAVFTLAGMNSADAQVSMTSRDNEDGSYTIEGVPFGEYTLSETTAPQGYEASFEETNVSVNAGNVSQAFVYAARDDEKTANISITKKDAQTEMLLKGATFKLKGTNAAGRESEYTSTDNQDGTYTIANVAFGNYTLTEAEAPQGYEATFEDQTVVVNAQNVDSVTAFTFDQVTDDEKKAEITINKIDAQTQEPLAGAEFTLAGKDAAGNDVTKTTTDNGDGTYTIQDVPFGSYELTESRAPKGYEVTFETTNVVVNAANVDDADAFTFDAEDDELTTDLNISKTDKQTGKALAGATFTLTGTSLAGNEVTKTTTDNGDGTYTIQDVPFGTYELAETEAPAGYEVTFEPTEVQVNADNVENAQNFVFTAEDDELTAEITVTKTDAKTGDKLAGAEFTLAGKDAAGKEVTRTTTDNGDGTYTFDEVPFGEYRLTETKAPKGYEITYTGTDVTVDASNVTNTFSYSVTDGQKMGTITVTKTDAKTTDKLAGAVFKLAGKDSLGTEVSMFSKDNDDGTYTFKNVPFGTYELTETKAPKGYERSFTGQNITIDAKNVEDTLTYDVTDEQMTGTITAIKQDAVSGAPLEGAEFTLTPEAGQAVKAVSDENGKAVFTDVAFGTYMLTEIKAPEGYDISFTEKEITISAQNVEEGVSVPVADARHKIDIEGKKSWNDQGHEGKRPESITVDLYADGVKKASQTVTEKDGWAYKFTGLDQCVDGKMVEYTVAEEPVKGYEAAVDGTNITNTYVFTEANLSVTKAIKNREWKDSDKFSFKLAAGQSTDLKGDPIDTPMIDKDTLTAGKSEQTVTFDEIVFEKPGYYHYTITELAGEDGTMTYDETAHDVLVEVSKVSEDSNILTAKVTYDRSEALTITNTYNSRGSVKLQAMKVLTGSTLKAGQFSFQLLGEDGQVLKDASGKEYTATNDASGHVVFDAINFTQDDITDKTAMTGSKHYTMVEVQPAEAKGFTCDNTIYEITVDLTDDSNGAITAVATPDNGSYVFNNSYNASGAYALTAKKTLNGGVLAEGQFSFELLDAEGTVLQTKTNKADGTVEFDPISYSQKDIYTDGVENLAGTAVIKYSVREVVPAGAKDKGDGTFSLDGYTYDGRSQALTVTLKDKGDGTITADLSKAEAASFTNTYGAAGEITLTAEKTLEGRDLEDGEFTFELVDAESGKVLQTKTNDAEGKINFDTITYSEADLDKDASGNYAETEKSYIVREVAGDEEGVTYDAEEKIVKVTLKDQGDGSIAASVDGADDLKFVNHYEANDAEPTSIVLGASKTLSGGKLEKGQFTFILKDEDGKTIDKATNNGDGSVSFDEIEYASTDVGTHTYTITEKDDNQKGITYDTTVYTVKVTVVDNGDGTLTATADRTAKQVKFENTKTASEKKKTPVKTGDDSNRNMWIFLMMLGLLGFAGAGLTLRKKERRH